MSTGYRSLLLDYYKVLQHRNSLLKSIAFENQDPKILEVWDQQLVELGSRLMTARADMIHKLGLLSRLMHRQISDGREDLELRYVPFLQLMSGSATVTSMTASRLEAGLPKRWHLSGQLNSSGGIHWLAHTGTISNS